MSEREGTEAVSAETLAALARLAAEQDLEALRTAAFFSELSDERLRAVHAITKIVVRALGGDADAWREVERLGAAVESEDDRATVRPPSETAPPAPPDPASSWPWGAALDTSALHAHADALASTQITLDGRDMSVSEYAALCATSGAFPARKRETHAKFGLADDASRQRLDAAWDELFDGQPALRELWQLLCRRYRAWLVQYGAL